MLALPIFFRLNLCALVITDLYVKLRNIGRELTLRVLQASSYAVITCTRLFDCKHDFEHEFFFYYVSVDFNDMNCKFDHERMK